MSLTLVENPFDTFLSLTGAGLNDGEVYIGIENMDPQTDPQAVYWDAAGTIPAAQPLETAGGYIMRLGTPARAYVSGAYSIRVLDRFGVQVFYAASVRQDQQVGINVRAFGAVGDGVHDDTSAIQAAIDSLTGIGGLIYFPPGTYLISAALKLRPNVALYAAPHTASVKLANGANALTLIDWTVYSADGASLEGLVIDGNWDNNSRSMADVRFACYVATANNVSIRNCEIKDYAGYGVYVTDGIHPLIEFNYLHDLSYYGIVVERTAGGVQNTPVIQNNRLEYVAWHQIVATRCIGARILNNDILATCVVGQVVNIAGTTVTWVSGPDFSLIEPGNFIVWNGGQEALITAKVSNTQLTLSAAPTPAAGATAASGTPDLISSTGSTGSLIQNNRTTGGVSIGISLFAAASFGNDVGSKIIGNSITGIGCVGISAQISGAVVRDALIADNQVIEAGLCAGAGDANFNSGCTIANGVLNAQIVDNAWISYGSAMLGLNLLATGGEVKTAGNTYLVNAGGISNGASVALSAAWSDAVASDLRVLDNAISFLITTTVTPPTANPIITITHRNIPPPGKITSFQMSDSSTGVIFPINTTYPELAAISGGTVLGTPAASATYRVVVRM